MNLKTYHLEHHGIPLEKIDPQALYVIEKLQQAGYKAYLVGGGVRDLLLKAQPKDFDVSTSAKPEEIKHLFRNAILIGRRFRLAHVRFGKKIIEVSTFRSGDSESSDLIVRDNQWGGEEEDVLRRDFTINGLFYDPHHQVVIDYVGGYQDLEKRILRTIGQPEVRFSQDPVRMIRLIKFCARFHFEIDQPTFEGLLSCRMEIVKSSSVRVLEELLRMLESGASKSFFYLLQQYGLLSILLPELAYFLETKDDSLVFQLLEAYDAEIQKKIEKPMDRALPLSLMIFPLLDAYLHAQLKTETATPHLGQITATTLHVIDCIFTPFFKFPRRLRGIMAFILSMQYRLTPLDGRPVRSHRFPKDPCTPLALALFKFRAAVQPELLDQYTLWTKAMFQSHQHSSSENSSPAQPQKKIHSRKPIKR